MGLESQGKILLMMHQKMLRIGWVEDIDNHFPFYFNKHENTLLDLIEISKPFQGTQFTVLNQSGKRIHKKSPHSMIAVKLQFQNKSVANVFVQALQLCHPDHTQSEPIATISSESCIV